jgi:hypothetical protein
MPADQVLQEALGKRMLLEGDLLHEVGLRTAHPHLLLQGLPYGS